MSKSQKPKPCLHRKVPHNLNAFWHKLIRFRIGLSCRWDKLHHLMSGSFCNCCCTFLPYCSGRRFSQKRLPRKGEGQGCAAEERYPLLLFHFVTPNNITNHQHLVFCHFHSEAKVPKEIKSVPLVKGVSLHSLISSRRRTFRNNKSSFFVSFNKTP